MSQALLCYPEVAAGGLEYLGAKPVTKLMRGHLDSPPGPAGLRVHEIAKVGAEDLDVAAGTLRVIGKGSVEAVVPLHPRIATVARGWPDRRRTRCRRSPAGSRQPPPPPTRPRSPAVVVNRQTTLIAGRHARAVFRNEARIIEIAENLTKLTRHPNLMLWLAWLVTMADDKIADDEALLLRHLVTLVEQHHEVADDELARLITIDPAEVWRRLDAEQGDLSDLIDAAQQVAAVDGPANVRERAVIAEIRERCERT